MDTYIKVGNGHILLPIGMHFKQPGILNENLKKCIHEP